LSVFDWVGRWDVKVGDVDANFSDNPPRYHQRDTVEKINLNGRLEGAELLSRLYDLAKLPSMDGRSKDAAGDIWQHTSSLTHFEMPSAPIALTG
jgi:hypothetical protein